MATELGRFTHRETTRPPLRFPSARQLRGPPPLTWGADPTYRSPFVCNWRPLTTNGNHRHPSTLADRPPLLGAPTRLLGVETPRLGVAAPIPPTFIDAQRRSYIPKGCD